MSETYEQGLEKMFSAVPVVDRPYPSWMTLGDPNAVVVDVTKKATQDFFDMVSRESGWWDDVWERGEANGTWPQIWGVFGGSGSGKSTLTKELIRFLGRRASLVMCDWYYRAYGSVFDGRPPVVANNYDHPGAIEEGLLRQHIEWLKQGRSVVAPDYDFTRHARSKEGRNPVPVAQIVLVEGILVGHLLKGGPNNRWLDGVIAVDAPWDQCVERRVERDVKRGRKEPESRLQVIDTVKPGHEEYVEPWVAEVREGVYGVPGILVENPDVKTNGGGLPAQMAAKQVMEAWGERI